MARKGIGPNPKIHRGRVRGMSYKLHSFASYSDKLTSQHKLDIKRMVDGIDTSYHNGEPYSQIRITGHAAFYHRDPTPKVPYRTQAMRRAVAVLEELEKQLSARGMMHLVHIADPVSRSTSDPIGDNATQSGRALNRRADVELMEADPEDAPWRWVCRLNVFYKGAIHLPYDLNHTHHSNLPATGTGVLISDRHVLTAAHNVRALRWTHGGRRLAWATPSKIEVIPAHRGGSHVTKRPHGTWRALPKKIELPRAFRDAVSTRNYRSSGRATAFFDRQLRRADLAILELQPKRRTHLGDKKLGRQGRFGWWGRSPNFTIGPDGRSSFYGTQFGHPVPFSALGYPEAHPGFRTGAFTRLEDGMRSADANLGSGHSGCPYWVEFGNERNLIAIHNGDQLLNLPGGGQTTEDWGVFLNSARMRWIKSVI